MSGGHFERLGTALTRAGIDRPIAVVDLDRYRANLMAARAAIPPGMAVRIVAKSLPALPLLRIAAEALGTDRLMTFSDDMLEALLTEAPDFSHLLGKPFPTGVAARILAIRPEAAEKVIWLVDTPARIEEYAALATRLGVTLDIAVELDVGLHRGGFPPARLAELPELLAPVPGLRFRGLMGYEAHMAKLPKPLAVREARRVEQALVSGARIARNLCANPILNTGGSLTFGRYGSEGPANEVALGSVLVKPLDFEAGSTAPFAPAAWIATPILKYMPDNPIPALGRLRRFLPAAHRAQLAIWGGYWKAEPVFPDGYRYSNAFGRSSNQEVWTGPRLNPEPVGNWAFLRPTQSEAVLADFGRIAAIGSDGAVEIWPAL